jgi:cell division protein FtsB
MDIERNIVIRLTFEHEEMPFFLDFTTLFYDFELLHDFSILLCVEDYDNYIFSHIFWYRNGRRLKDCHRLRVVKIIKESPLTVELVISSFAVLSGALWVFLQAIEKIDNWKLNQQKLSLEIEKLSLENEKIKREIKQFDYNEELRKNEKEMQIFNTLLKRLGSNSIKLKDIDLRWDGRYYRKR